MAIGYFGEGCSFPRYSSRNMYSSPMFYGVLYGGSVLFILWLKLGYEKASFRTAGCDVE